MGEVRSYKDLQIWQLGMKIAKAVYLISEQMPKSQAYTMIPQIQRCAVSIPSNIAEGHNRKGAKEYIQFLHIALGSKAELETQLILIKELNLCSDNLVAETLVDLEVFGKMTYKLLLALKAKKS